MALPRLLAASRGSSSCCIGLSDEPPCLPPIPSSNEDQRRGYQALNQPQVRYTCVIMNLCSCAELRRAQGIVLPSLISIPAGMQTVKTTWVIADKRCLDTRWATPCSLIMWYSWETERWICTSDHGETCQTLSPGLSVIRVVQAVTGSSQWLAEVFSLQDQGLFGLIRRSKSDNTLCKFAAKLNMLT